MDIAGEITIERPVERVFSFFIDRSNLTLWTKDLESVTQTKGNPGEKDAEAQRIYKINGKDEELTHKVLEVTPNKEIFTELEHKIISLRIRTKFEQVGDSTKVTSYYELKPKNMSINLMLPGIKELIKDNQTKSLTKLKQLIETH